MFNSLKESIFQALLMGLFWVCLQGFGELNGNISSTANRIEFKINNESSSRAVLTAEGFGIGNDNPSANLHVSGNAIVENCLTIGTTLGGANLHVSGSFALLPKVYSGNVSSTESAINSMIILNSDANINITLPDAAQVGGRVVFVKGSSSSTNIRVFSDGGLIEEHSLVTLSSVDSNYPGAEFISSGNHWYIMASTGNVALESFSLTQIEGLSLWLDANDPSTITTVSGNITQWDDKSGHLRHATQSVSNLHPSYSATAFGGKPAVVFSSVGDWGTAGSGNADFLTLPISAALSDGEHSIFVVTDSGNSGPLWIEEPNASWTKNFFLLNGGSLSMDQWPPLGGFTTAALPAGGLIATVTQTSNSERTIWANGVFAISSTEEYTGSAITQVHIGRRIKSSFNSILNGVISEVITINRAVSTAERQKIEGYLAHKWGLTAQLDAAHPYKNTAP